MAIFTNIKVRESHIPAVMFLWFLSALVVFDVNLKKFSISGKYETIPFVIPLNIRLLRWLA